MRLALGYRDCERAQDALVELEDVVAVRDRTLGPDHPDTLEGGHELEI